ncbi:molybdopterin/thiamine biosynthesis adenylyltransferase [Comamonas sp. BIGb0124]|uniref:ThiF family adenylyltransferase n=1 Tax=Comamonas sp. BIGb0124 TaxID=2485130 RepID=UPI000F48E309|nr:ThiF family adenylyltransferase [Comamonas sp. BIGb0124]ROR18475.1 molybdopterin/thiamine biosynthesis adenylyltransferase [Comamonas sp. BIGb0124]
MWWFISDPTRLLAERGAIDQLVAEDIGIENVQWGVLGSDLALKVDVDLRIGDKVRAVTMTYPLIFPNAPPVVRPIGENTYWGAHQYVVSGDLCLEYRADNWHPDLCGAVMLRSALKLMAADLGITHTSGWVLPSAHNVTQGQQIRGSFYRMNMTTTGQAKLATVSGIQPIKLHQCWGPQSIMVTLTTVTEQDNTQWVDPTVPTAFVEDARLEGRAIAIAADDERLNDIQNFLKEGEDSRVFWSKFVTDPIANDEDRCLMLVTPRGTRAFYVRPDGSRPYEFAQIPPDSGQRLPTYNARLAEKTFAILGCGSLGSKVATTITRSGARKFILIDADVLKLENLVRNELDAKQAGASKASAVAQRLKRVAAGVDVKVHNFLLGGQEPGSKNDTVVREIASADIIVDATGNQDVFNYAAAAARLNQKTMCWARVFAGGYGGLIARARPGLDPNPFDARAMIDQWCARPGLPEPPQPEKDYASRTEEGPPMVADDADVSAIAAHFARLLIDAAIGGDDSEFECSAYMIGLRREWIFERPFDTWPINLGSGRLEHTAEVNPDVRAEGNKALLEIFSAVTGRVSK